MARPVFFRRLPANIPNLWVPDESLLTQWSQLKPPEGGRPRKTRCSVQFSQVLGTYYDDPFAARDARVALISVFRRCVPSPSSMFTGPASIHHLIHLNDYVLDKTFVYGAIMLSKWLHEERLPKGVYGLWPPDPPPGAIPAPSQREDGDDAPDE